MVALGRETAKNYKRFTATASNFAVIRDDAEAGQVVIKFPSDLTPELRKRIRSAGFFPQGSRRAFRLRKISVIA